MATLIVHSRRWLYNPFMPKLNIFRYIACEGPGYLGDFLSRQGISFNLIKVDEGEPLPESIVGISSLIFMGGPMSANDDLPWIPPSLSLIRQAQQAGLPILGHCLGGQLIAKALGGTVSASPVREIGWLPVRSCNGPAARDWLAGLPREFEVFHWHGETFSIPDKAERILESRGCPNQGFVLGNTLALQCHMEMSVELVREWAQAYTGEIAQPAATVQNEAQMTADLEGRINRLHDIADTLYARWIQGLN